MDDDCKDSCGIGNDFSSYNDGGFCPINDDNSYSNQGGNDFSSYNDGGFCPINDDNSYSNQGGNDFSSYNDGGFCPINDDNSYSPPPPYPGNNENITINNFRSSTSYNEGVWGSSWGTRISERYPRTSERYSETRPLLSNGTNEDSPQNNCLCVIGSLLVLGIVLGGAFFLFSAIGETNCFISLVQ